MEVCIVGLRAVKGKGFRVHLAMKGLMWCANGKLLFSNNNFMILMSIQLSGDNLPFFQCYADMPWREDYFALGNFQANQRNCGRDGMGFAFEFAECWSAFGLYGNLVNGISKYSNK